MVVAVVVGCSAKCGDDGICGSKKCVDGDSDSGGGNGRIGDSGVVGSSGWRGLRWSED